MGERERAVNATLTNSQHLFSFSAAVARTLTNYMGRVSTYKYTIGDRRCLNDTT
jgi:hypothetical protein